ncbi:metallophosphoesterase family protein [Flavobacterium sp.]|jgi:serine/threonine protein phosphatase 1|uniref:metallophosphoesterase family protein n=1 Tax=Flavobacterium sp. TaxID=239 RepID=UPI002A7FC13B|nr:metallophosphoesterase family protein [Flavobacterium sp.]
MRTYVIGDIHGGLKALQEILKKVNLRSTDQLIFLGDYVDGWSESPQVIDYLLVLDKQFNCVFIRGNHDDLLLNYLKTNTYNNEWFKHGGESTVIAYKQLTKNQLSQHIVFLENLKDYYIDEENRLFIHAGFTNLKGVEFEYFKALFYWDRTLWEMALSLNPKLSIEDDLYPNRLKLYKEVYIGHTPVSRINETIPVNKACVWNLDTGAGFKGPLTILDVETKEYWQSTTLDLLYPNEIGRN